MPINYTNTMFWKKEDNFLNADGNEIINRLNNKLPTYEVVTNDIKPKLYFDIDIKVNSDDYADEIAEIIEQKGLKYLTDNLKDIAKPNIAIAVSHSKFYDTTKGLGKYSVRYFVSNIKANKKTITSFVKEINNIINNMKIDPITDYVDLVEGKLFDEGIYDTNRKMRCINTSKPNENRPLVLKFGNIEQTIITDLYDNDCVEMSSNEPEPITQVENKTYPQSKTDDVEYMLNECLKNKYCGTGDHAMWVKIAQIIKNEFKDEGVMIFCNWTNKFGSENKKNEAFQLYTKNIKSTPLKDKNRLTIGTLKYYAEKENPIAYAARFKKIKKLEFNDAIENTLDSQTEYSIAKVFVEFFGNKHKCLDIRMQNWLLFNEKNLWVDDNCGTTLRNKISTDLKTLYEQRLELYQNELKNCDDDELKTIYKGKIKDIQILFVKIEKTNDKNNIKREITDLLLDTDFIKDLNREKYVLPIKNNKMLNMKTLEIYDRTSSHKFSYECDAEFIQLSQEKEDDINEYFLQLFCGNQDLVNTVVDIFKSIFTGETLRYIFFFTGSGCNGKSLLFKILQSIFKSAMDTIDTNVILDKKMNNQLTTQFEKLDKCRLGYITELKETDKLHETNIKKISGGDPIDLRGLFKSNVTIIPTVNLCVLSNELAKFDREKAIEDRTVVIPFLNTFEPDITFESKMLSKKSEIFSYIMKRGVIRDKFIATKEMIEAKENYMQDNEKIDHLKDFVTEYFEITPFIKTEKITNNNFTVMYNNWLITNNRKDSRNTNTFITRRIKAFGITVKESNGKTWYYGLKQKEEIEEE